MAKKTRESRGSEGSKQSENRTGFETSRQTSSASGNEGLSGGGEMSEEGGGKKSEESGKYYIDCAEAGSAECSLRLSGTYDEVLEAGVSHGKTAHGMTGDDEKLREDVKGYMKPDRSTSAEFPESYQERGQSQAGRSPGLPS